MIHVSRSKVPVPSALDGPNSKAGKELEKARAHFAKTKPGPFKGFKAYKDQTVKDALEALFHGKCAYCECLYKTNQPVDIEHYRPKSGFVDASGELVKPGYWWLAADWHNLLPSCIDCNRSRGHKTIEDVEENLGKANQFPIADEAKRWRRETDSDNEARLLLDPCRDQPERMLLFGAEGEVKAATTATEAEKAIVKASIRVYGLNRSGLGTVRKGLAMQAKVHLTSIKPLADAIKNRTKAGDKPTEKQRNQLADIVKEVLKLRQDKSAFAAMVRQILDANLVASLDKFVRHFFADDLKDDDGKAPKPDAALSLFADRFATKMSIEAAKNEALSALTF